MFSRLYTNPFCNFLIFLFNNPSTLISFTLHSIFFPAIFYHESEKGQATVLSSVFFILIIALSLLLVISYENNQANASLRGIQNLKQQAELPMVYEVWTNGVTKLMTNMPFVITHIILPNGQVLNTSILVQNQIPILQLTKGFPWAIIVTDKGTWYNITPIQLPGLTWDVPVPSNVSGIPWDSNVLIVSVIQPNWNALQGIEMLNLTKDPLPQPVFVNNAQYYEGTTGKEVVLYIPNNTAWINITYYAPTRYVSNVLSPYWHYYLDAAPPGTFTPFLGESYSYPYNSLYFYSLLTTNPAADWPGFWYPLWRSAVYLEYIKSYGGLYYISQSPILDPGGGIIFNYSYVNATIGVYIPNIDKNVRGNNVQYTYIPFTDFEVTNLSAYVPRVVKVTTTESYGLGSPPPFVYVENGTWVYSPQSWVTAPLSVSPSTGDIATPYYYTYPFWYMQFPAHDYVGFPAYPIRPYSVAYPGYWSWYNIPTNTWAIASYIFTADPNFPLGIVTSYQYYITPNLLPTTNGYYGPATLLPYHYIPINVYRLDINLNQGVILNYGYNPYNGSWILLSKILIFDAGPITGALLGAKYVNTLPVYIVVPYGTYLLAMNAG